MWTNTFSLTFLNWDIFSPDVDDGIKREYVPVPIPVPVFIPMPMNMYTQVTPTPVSLPVPVRSWTQDTSTSLTHPMAEQKALSRCQCLCSCLLPFWGQSRLWKASMSWKTTWLLTWSPRKRRWKRTRKKVQLCNQSFLGWWKDKQFLCVCP